MFSFLLLILMTANPAAAANPGGVEARLRMQPPKNWDVRKSTAAPDPWIEFSSGSDFIRVHLFGGEKSEYPTPRDFWRSLEAKSMGEPARRVGTVRVGRRKSAVYERTFPLPTFDDPSAVGMPPQFGTERFATLIDGNRFFILRLRREEFIPDPDAIGKKAWKKFLKSLKLR